jgi:hypothetical protein
VTRRFEHYERPQAEDGWPIELGRGAMRITYKALDVDLHCPVALKDARPRIFREDWKQVINILALKESVRDISAPR